MRIWDGFRIAEFRVPTQTDFVDRDVVFQSCSLFAHALPRSMKSPGFENKLSMPTIVCLISMRRSGQQHLFACREDFLWFVIPLLLKHWFSKRLPRGHSPVAWPEVD